MRVVVLSAIFTTSVFFAGPAFAQTGDPPPPPPPTVGGGDIVDPPPVTGDASGGADPLFNIDVHANNPTWVSTSSDPCSYDLYGYEETFAVLASLLAGSGIPTSSEIPTIDERPDLYEHPWLFVWCPYETYPGVGLNNVFQVSNEPPPPDIMLASAQGPLTILLPEASFSPDAAFGQITGLETWLWLTDASIAPRTNTECIGPGDYACATIGAEYAGMTANMGDGTEPIRCADMREYNTSLSYEDQADRPHCGHVYTEASDGAFGVVLTSVWHITWSCFWDSDLDGVRESSCVGAIGTDLGFTGRTAAPVPLEVTDLQAEATAG